MSEPDDHQDELSLFGELVDRLGVDAFVLHSAVKRHAELNAVRERLVADIDRFVAFDHADVDVQALADVYLLDEEGRRRLGATVLTGWDARAAAERHRLVDELTERGIDPPRALLA
jgi:hypothetical protein